MDWLDRREIRLAQLSRTPSSSASNSKVPPISAFQSKLKFGTRINSRIDDSRHSSFPSTPSVLFSAINSCALTPSITSQKKRLSELREWSKELQLRKREREAYLLHLKRLFACGKNRSMDSDLDGVEYSRIDPLLPSQNDSRAQGQHSDELPDGRVEYSRRSSLESHRQLLKPVDRVKTSARSTLSNSGVPSHQTSKALPSHRPTQRPSRHPLVEVDLGKTWNLISLRERELEDEIVKLKNS